VFFYFIRKEGVYMTNNQRKFCDEYLIDCNATRAYKAAYPRIKNDNVAKSAGNRLLTFVDIEEYIQTRLDEMASAKVATAEEIIQYLTSVMRGKSTSEIVVITGYGDGYSTAEKVKKNPDEKERLKAAELLGKRYGLFTEKVNVAGTTKVTIVDDLDD
jgi:phage terminase small subunit